MIYFEKLFGLSDKDIKPNCIICPANDSGLFLKEDGGKRSKGLFFSAANTSFATIISVKNNFLAGDCILSLEKTAAENIYLFGSCAGTGALDTGARVLVRESINLESFSRMLKLTEEPERFYPDEKLFEKLSAHLKDMPVSGLKCATVSSIALEEVLLEWFAKNGISCLDMESSIVFSAARHIKRKAAAILYATDIVSKKPFYEKLDKSEAEKVDVSRKKLAKALCDFIKTSEK